MVPLRFEKRQLRRRRRGSAKPHECTTDLLHEFCKNIGESLARFEQLHLHFTDANVGGPKEMCADVDGVCVRGTGLMVDAGFNNDTQGVA